MKDIPTILTIFGVTGDLMAKKITPALYSLYKSGELPEHFKIFGFARRDFNGTKFHELLAENIQKYMKITDIDEGFYELFEYHQGQLDDVNTYLSLKTKIDEYDKLNNTETNKLFFYSIAPEFYSTVTKNIAAMGIDKNKTRLVIEKPFGDDEESAKKLDTDIKKYYDEDQTFRVDHYLGKDVLRYIHEFKQNSEYKDIWNGQNIRKVEITALEEVGVENRGAFYESVGAFRDVGQNHLLEILSLIIAKDNLKASRAEVMNKIKKYSDDEVKKYTFRAQYEGYTNIENVSPTSKVETYFKIATFLEDSNWQNIPFTIEAGKKLQSKNTEITVYFDNFQIVFSLYPEQEIYRLDNNGNKQILKHFNDLKYQYIGEYATLIKESIVGETDYFISIEEVLAGWKFADPIVKGWKNDLVPLETYKPGENEICKVSSNKIELK